MTTNTEPNRQNANANPPNSNEAVLDKLPILSLIVSCLTSGRTQARAVVAPGRFSLNGFKKKKTYKLSAKGCYIATFDNAYRFGYQICN